MSNNETTNERLIDVPGIDHLAENAQRRTPSSAATPEHEHEIENEGDGNVYCKTCGLRYAKDRGWYDPCAAPPSPDSQAQTLDPNQCAVHGVTMESCRKDKREGCRPAQAQTEYQLLEEEAAKRIADRYYTNLDEGLTSILAEELAKFSAPLKARVAEAEARLADLEACEKAESEFMAKRGVLYNCMFIDGWARVLDERDELRARLAEMEKKRAHGGGEYSCVTCGPGMTEPCEHWRNLIEDSELEKKQGK